MERWSTDARVVGAWLWGSEGTGTADALSDFDLFVVLADGGSPEGLDNVETWFPQYGEVLWLREVPFDAPIGGATSPSASPPQ